MTRRATLLSALALTTLLAACGGGPASAAPSATGSEATVAPTEAATAAPTEAATSAPSAAASESPSASADASTGPTTGRIEVPDAGIAVTLPDGWTRLDLTAADIDSILEAAGQTDPAMAEYLTEQVRTLAAAGLELFALGDDAAGGETLNVLVTPAMGLTLDLIESLNEAQLQQLAVDGTLETERVTLPAGPAVRFAYDLPNAGLEAVAVVQYAIVVGDRMAIVSMSGTDAADVEAIAGSIEALD